MNVKIERIEENMENEEYHSFKDYISSSFIKKVYSHSIYQALKGVPETDALVMGSLFHVACEDDGIEKLNETVKIWDSNALIKDIMDRRPELQRPEMTSEFKNEKARVEDSTDKTVITMQEYTMLTNMAEATMANPTVMDLNERLTYKEEVSYFGVDMESGIKMRVRPDREYHDFEGRQYIIDYKSVGSDEKKSLERKFRSQFYAYAYHIQAVFYSHFLGVDPRNFIFIACQKGEPYTTQAFSLSDETIDKAEVKLNDTMAKIAEWKRTGNEEPYKEDLILL